MEKNVNLLFLSLFLASPMQAAEIKRENEDKKQLQEHEGMQRDVINSVHKSPEGKIIVRDMENELTASVDLRDNNDGVSERMPMFLRAREINKLTLGKKDIEDLSFIPIVPIGRPDGMTALEQRKRITEIVKKRGVNRVEEIETKSGKGRILGGRDHISCDLRRYRVIDKKTNESVEIEAQITYGNSPCRVRDFLKFIPGYGSSLPRDGFLGAGKIYKTNVKKHNPYFEEYRFLENIDESHESFENFLRLFPIRQKNKYLMHERGLSAFNLADIRYEDLVTYTLISKYEFFTEKKIFLNRSRKKSLEKMDEWLGKRSGGWTLIVTQDEFQGGPDSSFESHFEINNLEKPLSSIREIGWISSKEGKVITRKIKYPN